MCWENKFTCDKLIYIYIFFCSNIIFNYNKFNRQMTFLFPGIKFISQKQMFICLNQNSASTLIRIASCNCLWLMRVHACMLAAHRSTWSFCGFVIRVIRVECFMKANKIEDKLKKMLDTLNLQQWSENLISVCNTISYSSKQSDTFQDRQTFAFLTLLTKDKFLMHLYVYF